MYNNSWQSVQYNPHTYILCCSTKISIVARYDTSVLFTWSSWGRPGWSENVSPGTEPASQPPIFVGQKWGLACSFTITGAWADPGWGNVDCRVRPILLIARPRKCTVSPFLSPLPPCLPYYLLACWSWLARNSKEHQPTLGPGPDFINLSASPGWEPLSSAETLKFPQLRCDFVNISIKVWYTT